MREQTYAEYLETLRYDENADKLTYTEYYEKLDEGRID